MDLSALKNPLVIGGGALIGVLVLMSARGGGGASAAPAMPVSLWVSQDNNATQLREAAINAKTKQTTDLYGLIGNLTAASYGYQRDMATVKAGIARTNIQAATALQLDIQGNQNRVQLATIGQGTAQIQANAAQNVAQTQANAAKSIASTQATSNIFGSLIGTVGKILPFFL